MLYLVGIAERPSVGNPDSGLCGDARRAFAFLSAMLIIQTPKKMVKKPQRSDIVLTTSVVLKPWKRIKEASRTAVVNVT